MKRYFLSILAAAVLSGCHENDPPPLREDKDPKVFIMYDNIGNWFNADVAEAGKAVAAGALAAKGQRVIVFHRRSTGSQIYELVRDKSVKSGYRANVLVQYAPGEMADLTPATISGVIGEIRALAPANHYGLAFGSHGRGWLPKNYTGPFSRRRAAATDADPFAPLWELPANTTTRYLEGYNQKIDVDEFADAIDGEAGARWDWDFIIFDDCFMASVEALYDIRHVADYFIASPTEIISNGFPYDRVVERLFRDDWNNLAGVARDFVDYYSNTSDPCATVAVVKAGELEALMESVRAIAQNPTGFNDVNPDATGIQYYEGLSMHVFFDLDEYMRNFSRSVPLYEEFRRQLAATVVFADHTDTFFSVFGSGRQHPVTHYSGLSTFIPWTRTIPLLPYYEQTEWYRDVFGE